MRMLFRTVAILFVFINVCAKNGGLTVSGLENAKQRQIDQLKKIIHFNFSLNSKPLSDPKSQSFLNSEDIEEVANCLLGASRSELKNSLKEIESLCLIKNPGTPKFSYEKELGELLIHMARLIANPGSADTDLRVKRDWDLVQVVSYSQSQAQSQAQRIAKPARAMELYSGLNLIAYSRYSYCLQKLDINGDALSADQQEIYWPLCEKLKAPILARGTAKVFFFSDSGVQCTVDDKSTRARCIEIKKSYLR